MALACAIGWGIAGGALIAWWCEHRNMLMWRAWAMRSDMALQDLSGVEMPTDRPIERERT